MNKNDLLVLYDYNYWANARILNAAARITPEQFISPANLSFGSLRGTLVHILGAEIVWRLRCQEGISLPALPSEAEYPTVEALRTGWAGEEQQMRAYLASLTDQSLQATVQYRTTSGVPYKTGTQGAARPCRQSRHPIQS